MESEIRKHLENNHPMVFQPDYLIISDALQLSLPGSPSDFLFKIADFGNCEWSFIRKSTEKLVLTGVTVKHLGLITT